MVPDEQALLQAVLDTPEDDGVRLVYADWLEEHGQPERADFIRVQCQLARTPADDPRRPELKASERTLFKKHGEVWTDPALTLMSGLVSRYRFSRGLLDRLSVEARGLILHAEALFRLAPVQALTVYLARNRINQWVNLPQMNRITTLTLRAEHLGVQGIRALAASTALGRLTTLHLSHNDVGDGGAEALSACPNLPRLAVLDLSMNNIGDAGALALARSAHLAGLNSLEFYHNPIGPRGREALRLRFGDGVKLSER